MSDPREPRSLNDREHRKFVTTGDRTRVAVRVAGLDDGPVGGSVTDLLGELLMEMRAVRRGLEVLTDEDLIGEGSDSDEA